MIKRGHQVTTWNTSTIGTGLTVGVMGFTYQYLRYEKMLYITFFKNQICVIQTEMLFVLSKYQAYFRQIRKIGKNMTCSDFCREFKNPIFNPQKLKNKNRS